LLRWNQRPAIIARVVEIERSRAILTGIHSLIKEMKNVNYRDYRQDKTKETNEAIPSFILNKSRKKKEDSSRH